MDGIFVCGSWRQRLREYIEKEDWIGKRVKLDCI